MFPCGLLPRIHDSSLPPVLPEQKTKCFITEMSRHGGDFHKRFLFTVGNEWALNGLE